MSTHTIALTPRAGLLRFALTADAAVTGVNALAYLAGAVVLDSVLGIPAGVLVALGAFLAAYATFVGFVATRPSPPRTGVIAVIEGNALWVAASLVLLALDTFTPSAAGQVWIAVQAVTVAGLAALQYAGLRREPR